MEDNIFEDYYNKTFGVDQTASIFNSSKEEDESLDFLSEVKEPSKDAIADANAIKGPINVFIKNINAIIGRVFNAEKAKGTRTDLIVTLVLGGLAFTLANVYFLITKKHGQTMSQEEYESTFHRMYLSALRDIEDNEKK